jgi:hypothetical protein
MIKDQHDALIHFIKNLDVEMVDLILDSAWIYLNTDKPDFIKMLAHCFDDFKNRGDSFLEVDHGKCKYAIETSHSYIFRGNRSNSRIVIIIKVTDGNVVGLQECYCFKKDADSRRLYIDPNKGLPF